VEVAGVGEGEGVSGRQAISAPHIPTSTRSRRMGMNAGEFSTIGFDTERMFVYNISATNDTNLK
jgi:hypothetical protein